MLSIYYKLWVDTIVKIRSIPKNADLWKFYALAFISMSMALNLWFVSLILLVHFHFSFSFFPLKIDLFPGTVLDTFIAAFASYLLPFLILNYFLIFYKNRYELLVKKYKYYNGKLFLLYFLCSTGGLVVYLLLGYLIAKLF